MDSFLNENLLVTMDVVFVDDGAPVVTDLFDGGVVEGGSLVVVVVVVVTKII